jgi:hypothetical protein
MMYEKQVGVLLLGQEDVEGDAPMHGAGLVPHIVMLYNMFLARSV